MIKFIHTGDIHLGSKFNDAAFPRKVARARRQDMWKTFFDIVDLARCQKVHFLLITGDLFEDSLISVGDLKRINEAFKTISKTNVVIAPGNHDLYWSKSSYKAIDWAANVQIFTNKNLSRLRYNDLGVDIYGFAWTEKYIESEFSYDINAVDRSRINMLMLHGDLYNSKSKYLPLSKNYLEELDFDYIALGHIHKYGIISENICYPGSPEPLDFSETGKHGVVIGEIINKEISIDFLPIAKREFITEHIALNPDMSFQLISNRLQSYRDKDSNLYRVFLTGIIDSDIEIDELIKEVEFFF